MKEIRKIVIGTSLIFTIIITSFFMLFYNIKVDNNSEKFSAGYNKEIIKKQKEAIYDLIAKNKYKCCMNEPCSRCFAKEGNHDKDLVCDCLVDIMNGKHPCGECIGEILEGEGISIISEYFATAIAEELGTEHLETLKKIISEKYDMPVDKQI